MGGYKKFIRVIAFSLLPVFGVESVWSAPASAAEVFIPHSAVKTFAGFFSNQNDPILTADFVIKNPPPISAENGEKVDSFSGTAPQHVFVIQDAHALPEAQKAAAQILDFWISKLGLNFVGLEGGTGELPYTMLGAFPHRASRKMIADVLLNEAVIGGPEYLQLTRYPSLKLWGIENRALYNADREAFMDVVNNRKETLQLLQRLLEPLNVEAHKILPAEYLRLRKVSREAHESSAWKNYITVLQKMRTETKVSGEYPAFDFWLKAQKLSEQIHAESLPLEIKQIKTQGVFGLRLARQIQKLIDGVEPDSDVRLEAALWQNHPKWLKNFPSSVNALKTAYLTRRIGRSLFEETSRLEKEITAQLCPQATQKQLINRMQVLDVLGSLVRLSLTAEDYVQFTSHRSKFHPVEVARLNGTLLTGSEISHFLKTIKAAEKFYSIAAQRDEALARNYVEEMRRRGLKMGALVIGGFHSAGLLQYFKQHGISYEVVRPKIRSENPAQYQSLYEKRMTTQTSKLEMKPFLSAEQKQLQTQAHLQLQTPRREDMAFAATLGTILTGLSAAFRGRPFETSDVLVSSAASLTPDGVKAVASLTNSPFQTWASRDGATTVAWFPGNASAKNSLIVATGPLAESIAGSEASEIQFEGRAFYLRWQEQPSDAAPVLPKGFKLVTTKRSEIRHDDLLAWVTLRKPDSDLGEQKNFYRALELRLEAFAEVLNMADASEKTLWSPGLSLTFSFNQGKINIKEVRNQWKDWNAETAAAVLIALEEYLGAYELSSQAGIKSAAVINLFSAKTLERWKQQNLLGAVTANQPAQESWNLLDDLIFSGAEMTRDNKSGQMIAAVWLTRVRKENEQGRNKINLAHTRREWQQWVEAITAAEERLAGEIINELEQLSPESTNIPVTKKTPIFILRHASKGLFGNGFDRGFTHGLEGESLLLAQALDALNLEVHPKRAAEVAPSMPRDAIAPFEPATSVPLVAPSSTVSSNGSGVHWFEGLPKIEDLEKYEFEQLKAFLKALEDRRAVHSGPFLSDSKKVLPYFEKLVATIEAKIRKAETALEVPVSKQNHLDELETSALPAKGEKPEDLILKYKIVPWMMDSLLLLAGVYFGDVPTWIAVGSAFLAYRSGWMSGTLLNEWGHLFAAFLTGKWKTVFSSNNWTGHLKAVDILSAFIPFMPLPGGFIEMQEEGGTANRWIRWGGWMFGVVFFLVLSKTLLLGILPIWIFYISFGATIAAKIVSFISDFMSPPKDETCAACGNLGVMAVNQGDETADFMQSTLRSMGDVLQVRGGQAGGSVVLREVNGKIVPDLNRGVNTKRGVLRNQMDAGAKNSLKKDKTPKVYFDFRHVRFGTSSAPSKTETHPFMFKGHFISHNGDFDNYRIAGKMRENFDIGVWLNHVVGFPNIEAGDSPKSVGMLDYLITKGKLFESLRFAYHEINNSEGDYELVMTGQGPAQGQLDNLTNEFRPFFVAWEKSGDKSRETLIKRLMDSLPHYPAEMMRKVVQAYFENDLYRAVQIFSASAEGTFGFIAGSVEYPNRIVMYGDSQPLSIGFNPSQKMMVWTSEPAVLKVPLPDGSRIPFRMDLLQDVGEIFEITLPQSGIPVVKVYDKRAKKELSHAEMQKSFRLIDMLKSKYVSPLPVLDYQNQDMVASDLKDMAGVLDRLREDWMKAESTNRQTAGALVQILVEKYIGKMIKDHSGIVLFGRAAQYASKEASILAQAFMGHEIDETELMLRIHAVSDFANQLFEKMRRDPATKLQMNAGENAIEDPVDILITGMATNLWAAEPFAARLSEMFPRLRIATTSSNKILRALKSTGLQTPIKRITVRENSRMITISNNTIVIVADGDMGQDFAPLNTTIALRKLIGDRLFVVTPEYDTKLGALVQNFHKDAPFEKRIFRTFVGNDTAWRPAEATTVSQQVVDQTFTEILLRLGQDMRQLFKNSDPFRMSVSSADFEQLRRHNREHTHAKMPEITGHNLDGSDRADSATYQKIRKPFTRWSQHISENVWAWYVIKAFILLTVTFSFPSSSWMGLLPWATALGNPLVLFGVHFFDAVIYASSAYFFRFALRLIQGRETMHRQGARSFTIADVPKVNQIIKQYLTKLTAQATFLTDFFVDASNPADHGPYKDPHRVRRGSLIVLGLTEAKLVGLGHAFKSAKLYGSQAQGIQSLPFQTFWDFVGNVPVIGRVARALGFKLVPPEILTVGQHNQLEKNSAQENVYLGERVEEIKASTDRLVQALTRIQSLHNRARDIEGVVHGRIENLNEFATGDFNKDVASLSEAIMNDLGVTNGYQHEIEIAVEGYLRRHVFLTGFIEERFFQNRRIAAMQVGFHHMVSRYSYAKKKIIFKLKQILGMGHRHWETQSHLRVATTASPESGADVTSVAQRMAPASRPQTHLIIDAEPDELPFHVIKSEIADPALDAQAAENAKKQLEEAQKVREMTAVAKQARERLKQLQNEVAAFELSQISELAELIYETDDILRRAVYQAVFHRYVRTQGGWLAHNGMAPELSRSYTTRVGELSARAGVAKNFGRQSVNHSLPTIGFDVLRKKHSGNPRGLAIEIADKVLKSRSENRTAADTVSVKQGLKTQDAMRAGLAMDGEYEKTRVLLSRPAKELQDVAAGILGSEVSDTGLVVLERPYSHKWVSRYLKILPQGARVVLRTPQALSVEEMAAYSRELSHAMRRKIFKIEVSAASSENWIREKTKGEFDGASVIQVEAFAKASAEENEMLLLSASMAAGHILVLGQTQRLTLPGMQWIQIKEWVNRLYNAVMTVERSA